ncbi:hypothetical protein HK099_008704 [Clydaea vesicula]|uniref:RSE1/DDB1/CPSF1 C-terminal domain-containing protein n=1 Tax=Clydaea vesicula TaxID=447962 RepID=A0AAD5U7P8_9FUNG|nr:hypothetical protein HK099_008704 [Clydaea vesicula]
MVLSIQEMNDGKDSDIYVYMKEVVVGLSVKKAHLSMYKTLIFINSQKVLLAIYNKQKQDSFKVIKSYSTTSAISDSAFVKEHLYLLINNNFKILKLVNQDLLLDYETEILNVKNLLKIATNSLETVALTSSNKVLTFLNVESKRLRQIFVKEDIIITEFLSEFTFATHSTSKINIYYIPNDLQDIQILANLEVNSFPLHFIPFNNELTNAKNEEHFLLFSTSEISVFKFNGATLMCVQNLPLDELVSSTLNTAGTIYFASISGNFYKIQKKELLRISPISSKISLVEKRLPVKSMLLLENEVNMEKSEELQTLILFGDNCDSEIIEITRNTLSSEILLTKKIKTIQNWAPVIDFKLCDLYNEGKDTMFFTSNVSYTNSPINCKGNSRGGAIREVKNGISVKGEVIHNTTGALNFWALGGQSDQLNDSYLAITFPFETRLMILKKTLKFENENFEESGGYHFEDISVKSAIVREQHTLFFGNLTFENDSSDTYLVQVCCQGVYVTCQNSHMSGCYISGKNVVQWISPANTLLLHCSCIKNCLLIISKNLLTGENLLLKLLVRKNINNVFYIDLIQQFSLNEEPSCCNILNSSKNDTALVAVGTYKPSLVLLSLEINDEVNSINILHTEDFPFSFSKNNIGLDIPNSVCFYQEFENGSSKNYIIVGLRDGNLLLFSLNENNIKFIHKIGFGILPVVLIDYKTPNDANINILCFSNRSARIFIKRGRLLLTSLAYPSISLAKPFNLPFGKNSLGIAQHFLAISSENALLNLQINKEKSIDFRMKIIGETPRRILYDHCTGKLIVSTTFKDDGGGCFSEIKIIDPLTGKIIQKECLPKNEVFWDIKKEKRYICIGTFGYRKGVETGMESGKEMGRVLVYNLKQNEKKSVSSTDNTDANSKLKFRRLGEFKCNNSIFSVVSYLNGLISGAQIKMRSDIHSLSTNGDKIIVGSERESISFYTLDPKTKKFEFLASDRQPRYTVDCFSIRDNLAVGSDKDGNFFGFTCKNKSMKDFSTPSKIEKTLENSFLINVGQVVVKIQKGNLVHPNDTFNFDFHEKFLNKDINLGWKDTFINDEALKSVDTDFSSISISRNSSTSNAILYGSTMLGSIFAFVEISKESYKKLIILQGCLMLNSSTRPLFGETKKIPN